MYLSKTYSKHISICLSGLSVFSPYIAYVDFRNWHSPCAVELGFCAVLFHRLSLWTILLKASHSYSLHFSVTFSFAYSCIVCGALTSISSTSSTIAVGVCAYTGIARSKSASIINIIIRFISVSYSFQ